MKKLNQTIFIKSALVALLVASLTLNFLLIVVIHIDTLPSFHGMNWLKRIEHYGVFEFTLPLAAEFFFPTFIVALLVFWLSSNKKK